MKKFYIFFITVLVSATFVGCQNPLAKLIYKYEKNKIVDIIKNADNAAQLNSSFQANVDTEEGDVKSQTFFEYAGYTDEDASEIDGNIKMTSEIDGQDGNSDYKGVTAGIVGQSDEGLYITPKLIKKDDTEIDVFKDGKSLYLTEESMKQISETQGEEISDEDIQSMKDAVPMMKKETISYLTALAENMIIVNKLDHTYEIEISRDDFIASTETFYENMQEIYDESFGTLENTEALGEDNLEEMEDTIDNIDEILQDDPIIIEMTLNDAETEIENANTTLNLEDDEIKSQVEMNISMTDFNQKQEITYPDDGDTIALDQVTTAAEAGNLSDLLNPEFITAMGMTAADVNSLGSLYIQLMKGDTQGLDLNSLQQFLPDDIQGLDAITEEELQEMQNALEGMGVELDSDINDLLEGLR